MVQQYDFSTFDDNIGGHFLEICEQHEYSRCWRIGANPPHFMAAIGQIIFARAAYGLKPDRFERGCLRALSADCAARAVECAPPLLRGAIGVDHAASSRCAVPDALCCTLGFARYYRCGRFACE